MTRASLVLAFGALALVACAPERGSDEGDTPRIPPGFELAAAKQAVSMPAQEQALVSTLDVAELQSALADGEVTLIDVRTAEKFAEGHIAGAIHIPLDSFDPALLPGSGDREIILYCRSDRRSGIAASRYAEATGEPMRHLEGGILAWEAAGAPVFRP